MPLIVGLAFGKIIVVWYIVTDISTVIAIGGDCRTIR